MADLFRKKKPQQAPGAVVVRGARQKRLLSEAIQLEEEVVPQFLRPALMVIGAMVCGALVWASVVDLTEVTTTTGEVVPSGSLKVVQHPDGGVVSDILVSERQLVEPGEALLRLDAGQARANLEQVEARAAALRLRAERLRAFAEQRDPRFWDVAPDYPDLIADQNEIWRTQIAERQTTLEVLATQIEQRKRELDQLRDALTVAERQQELTRELMEMRKDLAAKKLVSQVVYLETKRAAATAEGEAARLRHEIRVTEEGLAEVQSRRENTETRLRQDALNEMGTVNAELAEVKSSLERARLVTEQLDLRAPVRGLVQNLQVTNVGEVIKPSQTVMRIVPIDDTLEVEVRIPTRDIGHVKPGQHVTVKITSYNYTRFGSIDGVLRQISASSLVDERNQPYFRGKVTLKQNHVGNDPAQYPVLPGMSVQADIVTGDKTLLEYLVKPVSDAFHSAFRER